MSDLPAPHPPAEEPGDPQLETTPSLRDLGSRLVQAREQQGLSLADLAARLHIGTEQLRALEAGDLRRLPEPVYVIAQAKRVAQALAIDVDEPIAAFRASGLIHRPLSRATTSPSASPVPAGTPAASHPGDERTGRALRASLGLLIGGLVSVGVLSAIDPLLRLRTGGLRLSLPAPRSASTPSVVPVPHATIRATPGTTPSGTTPAPEQVVSPSAPPPPTTAELVLRTGSASWLEIRDLSGRQLFEGTLKGEKRFPLGKGIEVMAGRPDLVTYSIGDAPPRPLGTIEQVLWRRFSPPVPAASAIPSLAPGAPAAPPQAP